jgi:hypothetical protein
VQCRVEGLSESIGVDGRTIRIDRLRVQTPAQRHTSSNSKFNDDADRPQFYSRVGLPSPLKSGSVFERNSRQSIKLT